MYEAGSRHPGSQCEQTITQRGGLRRISPGSDADLAKRKAAESAALKLGWNKLEERVGESCSLISIKIAVSGRRGYCCHPINDHGYTLRQLFGELILGDARHLRQCLDNIGAKRLTKLTR